MCLCFNPFTSSSSSRFSPQNDRTLKQNNGVRKEIRRGAAEDEVRKNCDCITGALRKISRQRRKADLSNVRSMRNILQTSTWMDQDGFEKACPDKKREEGGFDKPLHGTWIADFLHPDQTGCEKVPHHES